MVGGVLECWSVGVLELWMIRHIKKRPDDIHRVFFLIQIKHQSFILLCFLNF